ncbi:hypothetical protein ACFWFI_10275 [Streptomyces sp. NPDC060209]|uniref:hypothetical protein n=1 Tax=Streptomyces sp. NPDC060209 TaxID=3347073 RepID=UPI00365A3ACF
MLKVSELLNLRLGKLQSAVADWGQMVSKLQSLATGEGSAGTGGVNASELRVQAENADWEGQNASVTRQFVTKTAAEFTDVVTEARSVHKILQDSHDDLKKHKEDLQTTVDRWAKRNVHINENGGAVSSVPSGAAAGTAKIEPASQDEVDAAAAEVGRILSAADEVDRIAARALRKHAAGKYNFSDSGYKGLEDADRKQGIEDADAMLKLAAKADGMTDAQLKHFNEVAAYQRDNPAFAERFATKLGPEGTLQFWRSLADPGHGDTPVGDRAKILSKVQDNLGLTLATASHVDSPAMQQWKDGIIAAGDDRIKHPGIMSAPYGYQVMSSLMTKGKWDGAFLGDYGESLIEFERSNKRAGPDWLWDNPGHTAQLDYPPNTNKPDNDPIAGFMEALGRNPEASLDFFNGSSGQGAKDDLDTVSNWDYLVDKDSKDARTWPLDGDGKTTGYTNLGHALESATLGRPYDASPPSIPELGSEAQNAARDERTELMEKVVDHYKTADTIEKQDGIRESLATMAAGHIDSLNYTMDNTGGSGDLVDRDGLFGKDAHRLRDFGETSSMQFMRALGADEDSHATLSVAQQVYGASLMTAQGNDTDSAVAAGLHSAKMHGMLDESRIEAIGKEFGDEKTARNLKLEQQGAWRDFAAEATIGAAVGVTTAAIVPAGAVAVVAVPLAIETIGGAATTQFGNETMQWLKDHEFENHDEAAQGIDKAKAEGRQNAMGPLLNYVEAHNMESGEVRELRDKAAEAYDTGGKLSDTDDARGW